VFWACQELWIGQLVRGEVTYVHVEAGIVAGIRIGSHHFIESGGGIFGPVLEARVGSGLGCKA
jgi:hypothetical protein